ncbi:Virginiamycin A acetyltransferase [Roseovarius indicus]|uniref:Virginiamycin A acetyltransferase n=1 Tax=Roseovarius indicus TaxID=540747 RepID=A0A0T5P9H7_9RHOB|nr:acyltransferase [Roseovarius indicus]KRS17672.1 hypothetical protein XM52_11695 [Roseovarius indicus]QEW24584.1 Virginiamycin A acetyltransferase [Roseovarius indicus]SFE26264.1 transferase hexapeptide (six repeat-containing protein) [Roseovarius indicus]
MNETYDIREFLADPTNPRHIEGEVTCPASARGRVKINPVGNMAAKRFLTVRILADEVPGSIIIGMGPGSSDCTIHSGSRMIAKINFWRRASLTIGEGTTMNGVRLVVDEADVEIGKDTLWSDEIIVQSNDQHGLVDLADFKVIRSGRKHVRIGDHVWVGRRSLIMPDIEIGEGSVIGAASLVTKSVEPFTIVAGNPARVVRENATWCRSPKGFSEAEEAWVRARMPGQGGD